MHRIRYLSPNPPSPIFDAFRTRRSARWWLAMRIDGVCAGSRRHLVWLFGLLVIAVAHGPASAQAIAIPEMPRAYVDTTPLGAPARILTVVAGGDFQGALNTAQPGDMITLAAGVTFTGNFTLPAKTGTGWITVRTSAPDEHLPPPGVRITPAYVARLPKVVSPNANPALATAAGAHHYRLIGIEVTV